jgi:type II secretory pathway pseudopilin PulG
MRNEQGFSLVEGLLTAIVIAILATVTVPQFIDYSVHARVAVTEEKMSEIKKAILGDARVVSGGRNTELGYEIHCKEPPSSLQDLVVQPSSGNCAQPYNPFTKRGWRGPYLKTSDESWDRDAWGQQIEVFGSNSPARTIRSCGPDHLCGNNDDITLVY